MNAPDVVAHLQPDLADDRVDRLNNLETGSNAKTLAALLCRFVRRVGARRPGSGQVDVEEVKLAKQANDEHFLTCLVLRAEERRVTLR